MGVYFDLILFSAILLLLGTLGAFVVYFARVRRVRDEYERARAVIGDVITSFTSQLDRQDKEVDSITQEVQTLSSQGEKLGRRVNEFDERAKGLAQKLETFTSDGKEKTLQIEELTKKIDRVDEAQSEISQRLEQIQKIDQEAVAPVPRGSIKAAIPIKREKALAPLTETELRVLEILAEEKKMAAPGIRKRIELTREHTSRLMKKLYEDGYLERDTRKLPYVYSIKEEMLRILRRRAAQP